MALNASGLHSVTVWFSLSSPCFSVKIPDAAFIQAARRKRELARTPGDYISLDVNHPSTTSESKRSNGEDSESDPDDHEKRILFTPKPQTLRQRMAEESSVYLTYLPVCKDHDLLIMAANLPFSRYCAFCYFSKLMSELPLSWQSLA